MRYAGGKKSNIWVAVVLGTLTLFLPLVVYPLVPVLYKNVLSEDGDLSLAYFTKFFVRKCHWSTLVNSLKVAIVSTPVATVLGLAMVYMLRSTQTKGSKHLSILTVISYLSPPFIEAYAWIQLLGRNGSFTEVLNSLFYIKLDGIYGFAGTMLVFSFQSFPLVYMYISGALKNLDNSLSKVAESLGCTAFQRVMRIIVPLVIPTMLASPPLVSTCVFSDFGTPMLTGGDYKTLPVLIYSQFMGEVSTDDHSAAALCVIVIDIILVLFFLQRYLDSRFTYSMAVLKPMAAEKCTGTCNTLSHLSVYAVVLVAILLQITVIVTSLLVTGGRTVYTGGFPLGSYRNTLLSKNNNTAIFNTYLFEICAITIVVVSGILISYLTVRERSFLTGILDTVTMFPYIIPGSTLGVSFLYAFNNKPLLLSGITTTIIISLSIWWMPYTICSGTTIVGQISPSVEEAAINLGCTETKSFVRVTVPMMMSGVLFGTIMSWITLISELSSSITLYTSRIQTLTVVTYAEVIRSNSGNTAAYSIIPILTSIPSLLVFLKATDSNDINIWSLSMIQQEVQCPKGTVLHYSREVPAMAGNQYRDYIKRSSSKYATSIISLPFVLMGLLPFINAQWVSTGSNRKNNALLASVLDSQVISYKEGLEHFSTDYRFWDTLKQESTGAATQVNRLLYGFTTSQPIRSTFALTDTEGHIVSSSLLEGNRAIFLNSAAYKSPVEKMREAPALTHTMPSRLNFAHGQARDLFLVYSLVDADGICGYLFFDLMDEQIYETVREHPLDDVVITDRYDNLTFAVGRQNADPMEKYPTGKYRMDWQKGNIVRVNNKHYHIRKEALPESSLILYTLVSMEFQRSLVTYGTLFLGLAGTLMVIMIPPLTLRITKKNLQAIDELQSSLEETGRGNMDYRLKSQAFDELRMLSGAFRDMVIQREELMLHNNELAECRRIMEIKQLEEQFNPHFIFNVLETLRYEIVIDSQKVSEMVTTFANLMRYSIYYGSTIVPLQIDVEHINDYLPLQKMRYNHRPNYHIDVPEELMDLRILKLLLQPVVENSPVHGMRDKHSVSIIITARMEDSTLVLCVEDNGSGISRERLTKLRGALEQEDTYREHIGLYNSHRVARLLYGPSYGLTVESPPGNGTRMSVTLPADMEEDIYV